MGRDSKVKNKLNSISDEDFMNIVSSSFSYSEILRSIGLTTNGGSSTFSIKNRIKILKLSISHFRPNGKKKDSVQKPLCDILTTNSNTSRQSVKKRLLKENVLKYKCNICGIFKWNNKELSLHLDHINGVNNDNRIENLRLLCPNCHSQTETYAGKNKKGIGLGDQS